MHTHKKNPNQQTPVHCNNCTYNCPYDCTTAAHNTARNSFGYLPPYTPITTTLLEEMGRNSLATYT